MFSTDKPMTPDEHSLAMRELQVSYQDFIKIVSDNRNMSIEKVTALADGVAFTGSEAVQNGLIDRIGTIDDVRTYLQSKIGGEAIICGIYY
jgi:protease-4